MHNYYLLRYIYIFTIWGEINGEPQFLTDNFLELPKILGTDVQYPQEYQQFLDFLINNDPPLIPV